MQFFIILDIIVTIMFVIEFAKYAEKGRIGKILPNIWAGFMRMKKRNSAYFWFNMVINILLFPQFVTALLSYFAYRLLKKAIGDSRKNKDDEDEED